MEGAVSARLASGLAYAHVVVAKLAALVLPLGHDTFAVAAALGTVGILPAGRLRISLLFSAFEAGMPLVGLALGAPLGVAIGGAADYVAIGVLLASGLYTLLSPGRDEEERLVQLTHAHGMRAVLLGVSISLDELAIGFTLGLLRSPPRWSSSSSRCKRSSSRSSGYASGTGSASIYATALTSYCSPTFQEIVIASLPLLPGGIGAVEAAIPAVLRHFGVRWTRRSRGRWFTAESRPHLPAAVARATAADRTGRHRQSRRASSDRVRAA